MSAITTHILDTTNGVPAAGVAASLERRSHAAGWQLVAEGITDADGRINDIMSPSDIFSPGHYRFVFEIGPYFLLKGIECFFPQISVGFVVKDSMQHYHIPLLLSPFGYSVYRGR